MCYAIPARLVEIKDNIGIVDYFGERKKALIDYSDVKVGDYVYVQGGILINKVSKKEAEEILEAFKELFFQLKKIDKNLAKVENKTASKNLLEILQKINLNKTLTKDELLTLLNVTEKNELKILFETANNIRQRKHGNACCVHGIIEFSNYCKNNCFWCGIRKDADIVRYRMKLDEIITASLYAIKKLNFKALVLQSGEDNWYTEEILSKIISELKKLNILIFLSIGERPVNTYEKLYKIGARGVLLRFETSNEKIYKELKPESTLKQRLQLIKDLKNMGFVLATGFLVGLPQETDEDIINNILLTKELKPDMYSFGPFIPKEGTPLQSQKLIDKYKILKIIAITRFVDKNSNILVTTAQETLDKNLKKLALLSGANSLMINLTPQKYKDLYCIYPRNNDSNVERLIEENIKLLYSIGRAPLDLGLYKDLSN
ncbi:MAG: HypC/HybG/HupF family hydrogenase formation chaperone [Candidatus Omnitrophica bacterium]|nr:HypC/HybG/HupF family hydrogenase formation chaperone [Candidatus Omnitrophota bacterium]